MTYQYDGRPRPSKQKRRTRMSVVLVNLHLPLALLPVAICSWFVVEPQKKDDRSRAVPRLPRAMIRDLLEYMN